MPLYTQNHLVLLSNHYIYNHYMYVMCSLQVKFSTQDDNLKSPIKSFVNFCYNCE